jgi:hypothetical protein
VVKSPNKNVKRLNAKQKRTLVQLSVAQKQRVVLFATQNKEFTPLTVTQAIIYINKAWRQVSQSTIVNCWRKADILDNKNIDYSIDLNNFELDIFFKEEIQKVTVDYVKALEKYRKDYDFEKYLNCDNDA